jgi:hypothetical protein
VHRVPPHSLASLGSPETPPLGSCALSDIPGYLLADHLCSPDSHKGGHDLRATLSRLFGACAALQLGVALASLLSMGRLVALLTTLGKMCTAGVMQINYLLPAQLFPSNLRTTGFGVASAAARVVCMIVPVVTRDLSLPSACLITASLALVAAISIRDPARPS